MSNGFGEATQTAAAQSDNVGGTYDHIIVAGIGYYLRLDGSVLYCMLTETLTIAKKEL